MGSGRLAGGRVLGSAGPGA